MSVNGTHKKLLWWIVYVLWIILDVFEVWDRSHSITVFLAVFGTICVSWADFSSRKVNLTLSASSVCVGAVVYFFSPPKLPDETESHGWLLPSQEATPNSCNSVGPAPVGALTFLAGNNAVLTTSSGKILVLQVGNTNELYVERDGQRLLFDADIHDSSGLLIARVIKNEFHLISGEYSYRDRSEDRSKLAVYDKYGKEILYVYYANPSSIIIRGVFVASDGIEVHITNDAITFGHGNRVSGNCWIQASPSVAGLRITSDSVRF